LEIILTCSSFPFPSFFLLNRTPQGIPFTPSPGRSAGVLRERKPLGTDLILYQVLVNSIEDKTMDITALQPGDKVRVIQDIYDSVDVATIIIVSINSVGTIMSFEEYCAYIKKITHEKRYENIAIHCSAVEQGIQSGEFLPVRIDEMAPLLERIQDFGSKKEYTDKVLFFPANVALIGMESLVKY
jgi:hypothetical protein